MSVDTETNLIEIPSHVSAAVQGSGYEALANGSGDGDGDGG